MKRNILDAIQIAMAILITGATAYAMQPTGAETVEPVIAAEEEKTEEPTVAPSKTEEKPPKDKQPEITWRDNPNDCNQTKQWIAADAPFDCIDKPVGKPVETVENTSVNSFNPGGDKEDWMRAAGIPESEWWYVNQIVTPESGWDSCAYYPGKSNCGLTASQVNATGGGSVACGIAQQKPCGKWAGDWRDPVAALRGQYSYVRSVYGGYAQAYAFWQINKAY